MGNLIRTVGHGETNSPVHKRAVGLLSDGSAVVMVSDMNQTGVSGDGGDNTGVPKIHFYHSTDRVNWTLKATVDAPAASTTNLVGSFVVDSADNLHLVFRWHNGTNWTMRYHKLTFAAGPTWTVGAVTIFTASQPSGYQYPSVIEVDTIGNSTDCLVVGVLWYSAVAGASKLGFVSHIRTTGGTWVAHSVDVLNNNMSQLGYADDMTISGDNVSTIGGDNVGVFAYYATRKLSNGTDAGDVLRVVEINTSTGARLQAPTQVDPVFHTGYGGGFRKFWLFNTAANQWDLAGVVDPSDFKVSLFRFSWNRTSNTYSSHTARAVSSGRGVALQRRNQNHNWAAVAHAGNGRYFFFANAAGQVGVATGRIENGTGKVFFDDGWQRWDNAQGSPAGFYDTDGKFKAPTSPPVEQVFAGATRNWGTTRIDAAIFYHNQPNKTPQAFRVESRSLLLPQAPTDLTPRASSTVTTDRPEITAAFKMLMYYAQIKARMQWQIASDAGFSTNLRTITESEADLVVANGTSSPYNAIVRAREILGQLSELSQGTWYIRARSIDWVGNNGAWSGSHTFTVSHPPQGADMYPTGGAVFLYGTSGNVTFTWKFTDPSPFDSQSAYRIVVEDANDGSVVIDSGKVASTVNSATIAIPSGGKDIDLRWKLVLWDSDDVAGPETQYSMFYVADPPAPAITAPTSGAVLTSGIPTISWTTGIAGTRFQQRYRVMVRQGMTVNYNSDWIEGLGQSIVLPVGHLTNNQAYTFRVEVQDNLGLTGVAEVDVTTDWVEPVGPADTWEVFTHDFQKRGYVYITWTDANMDPDFSSWNLYRRLVGEASWTQIATVTTGADRYAHRDYFVGSGRTYEYTLTQMVDRFGDLVESIPTKTVRVTPDADNYWLVDRIEPDKSIPLYNVNSDPFTEEYEQEIVQIIGAGRHVEYGDRLGYSGQLSAQLRDKFIVGIARENYVLNPAMSLNSTGGQLPDAWTYAGGGTTGEVSLGNVESRNPSPSGKTPYRVRATGLGNTANDYLELRQAYPAELPAKLRVTGAPVVLSAWLDAHPDNADKAYRLSVEWYNSSGSVISQSDSAAMIWLDSVDSFIPPGTDDGWRGNTVEAWRRFRFSPTVPANAVSFVVKIRLQGNGGASGSAAQLIVGGVQLEADQLTAYMDGDQFGSQWSGIPYLSYSYGNGYYTARQQRQALEAMKARKSWVYLRNPFGDLWKVAPGDIAVTRIAGVGRNELVDISMPYQEVR